MIFILKNYFGGSLNAGGGAFGASASGEVSFNLNTINDNINGFKQSKTSSIIAVVGTKESPAPIFLELSPVAQVLSKSAWGPTWDEYGIDARQRNLKEALNLYPVHVGAHIDKGMILILPQVLIICDLGL